MQTIRVACEETQPGRYDQDSVAQNLFESAKLPGAFHRSFGFPNTVAYVDLVVADGMDLTTLIGGRTFEVLHTDEHGAGPDTDEKGDA